MTRRVDWIRRIIVVHAPSAVPAGGLRSGVHSRRLRALFAVANAALLLAASLLQPVARAGSQLPPPCSSMDLAATTNWQGATGSLLGVLAVANQGSTGCALRNAPRIALIDAHGAVLDVQQTDLPAASGFGSLFLGPGEGAIASLRWDNDCAKLPDRFVTLVLALPDAGALPAPVLGPDGLPAAGAPRCDDPAAPSRLQVGAFRAAGASVHVPRAVSVQFAAGWNLVGGPTGSLMVGARALDTPAQASGGSVVLPVTTPLRDAIGYWAYFPVSTTLRLAAAPPITARQQLPAGRYTLIGNPLPIAVVVSGADAVYTYDASAGQYRATLTLQPGQGAWAFSASGGVIELRAAAP